MGKRDPKVRIYDPGYFEFGGQRFRNAGGASYGHTDMHRAIVVSSDTYFYSLGPEIGVDNLHDFSQQFGFGQITGIDLDGERKGILPSREWKRKHYADPEQRQWYAGETVSVAVGQGYNIVAARDPRSACASTLRGSRAATMVCRGNRVRGRRPRV